MDVLEDIFIDFCSSEDDPVRPSCASTAFVGILLFLNVESWVKKPWFAFLEVKELGITKLVG